MRADWNPVVVHDKCFGFGFDAVSNEFKVVRIILYKDNLELLNRELVSSVSVFSLGRKTWRKLDYEALFEMHSRSCNVGGFVYRLTSAVGRRLLKIVSFDLSTEVFAGIACPDEARFGMDSLPELTIFRDSLALLCEWDKKRYHIWVMKGDGGVDKSWRKFFSVDLDVVVRVPEQRIVGFSMKGLMLVVGEGNVVVSPIVEDVEVVKYLPPCPESAWHVESYVESLALLKEGEIQPSNLVM
uniref:F-box associated beta-propeller type 3 domain-containing protein n=1 Tax=Chenopodium quinoa TaxID=63459 RepID=A0A803MGI8_CHEQI